jgi:hypothetical protein
MPREQPTFGCLQEATRHACKRPQARLAARTCLSCAYYTRANKHASDANTRRKQSLILVHRTCVFRFHSVCPQPRQYANTPHKKQKARLTRTLKTQRDVIRIRIRIRQHLNTPIIRIRKTSLMLSHLSQNTSTASKVPSIPCVKTLVQGRGPTESSVQVKQVKQVKQVTSGMGSEATAGSVLPAVLC